MTIYQAPPPQWNDNNGSTVTHYYKIQYDVQENCMACFYTNRITGDSSVKYASQGETIDDLKQWVEVTHYPSALVKAGFKLVSEPLSDATNKDNSNGV